MLPGAILYPAWALHTQPVVCSFLTFCAENLSARACTRSTQLAKVKRRHKGRLIKSTGVSSLYPSQELAHNPFIGFHVARCL